MRETQGQLGSPSIADPVKPRLEVFSEFVRDVSIFSPAMQGLLSIIHSEQSFIIQHAPPIPSGSNRF